MSTIAIQRQVQRQRFVQHALGAALSGLPRFVRALTARAVDDRAAATAAERSAVEARQVRELARCYQSTDPGFAADLLAAAARHEGLAAD